MISRYHAISAAATAGLTRSSRGIPITAYFLIGTIRDCQVSPMNCSLITSGETNPFTPFDREINYGAPFNDVKARNHPGYLGHGFTN